MLLVRIIVLRKMGNLNHYLTSCSNDQRNDTPTHTKGREMQFQHEREKGKEAIAHYAGTCFSSKQKDYNVAGPT